MPDSRTTAHMGQQNDEQSDWNIQCNVYMHKHTQTYIVVILISIRKGGSDDKSFHRAIQTDFGDDLLCRCQQYGNWSEHGVEEEWGREWVKRLIQLGDVLRPTERTASVYDIVRSSLGTIVEQFKAQDGQPVHAIRTRYQQQLRRMYVPYYSVYFVLFVFA